MAKSLIVGQKLKSPVSVFKLSSECTSAKQPIKNVKLYLQSASCYPRRKS